VAGVAGAAGNTDIRLQFAPDNGKHLFFAQSGFAGYELWVDGQKMPGYFASGGGGTEGTVDPLITRDGEHFAYVAAMGTHPGDKRALIVDGKDAGYLATNLQYTQDNHLFGIVRDTKGEHLYVDGKQRFQARQIIAFYPAPTGGHVAAVLLHTNPDQSTGQFVLLDGTQPVEATLCQNVRQVIFSPDGKRYAAVCTRSGAEWMVIDGKKGQEYQSIDQNVATLTFGPAFSPDSSKIGYGANSSGKKFIVINDDESDAYDGVAGFMFSPEGKHTVTFGNQQGRCALSVDGKVTQIPLNRGFNFQSFQFSPDQTRYAYFLGGSPNDGGAVVVDGKDTGLVGTFNFSADSKHVAVVGYRASDTVRGLFVDGDLAYAAPQSIPYRAFSPDGNHLYWMSMEPLKTPTATDAFGLVTYADGKPVANSDRGAATQAILFPRGFAQAPTTPPAWSVGSDGTLTMFAPSDDGIKRIKVTPDPNSTLATVLQAAQSGHGRQK
jgi:hypothetical protein